MTWRFLPWMLLLAFAFTGCGPSNDGTGGFECAAEELSCDGACADPMSDPRHCGGCGIACGDGEVCDGGSCVIACPRGQAACDGACVNLAESEDHCGACGNACGAGETCIDGACSISCPAGQTVCDGACVFLDTSRSHCGACGNACAAGEVCADGACRAQCPAGQRACEGGCHDTETSRFHCGACGVACAEDQVCVDGSCTIACPPGFTNCDGVCRALSIDEENCGACGWSCRVDEVCDDGVCTIGCPPNLEPCGGACRDVRNDRMNCGTCGNVCGTDEICVDGACTLSCSGFESDVCNGACTNTDYDPLNCGACGTVCAPGEVCDEGTCTTFCGPNSALCDGTTCTSLNNDPENCGECGNSCSAGATSTGVCAEGTCVRACIPGQADCDADLGRPGGNGCETAIMTDANNCGGCGVVCDAPPNATAGCIAGACGVGTCHAGWADCDQNHSTGCETDILRNAQHCGGCNIRCTGGDICIDGICDDPGPGESCTDPFPLHAGANRVWRSAASLDHFTAAPSCDSTPVDGGDLVLRYDATFTGIVDVTLLDKPLDNRWHLVVGDAACGNVAQELACDSRSALPRVGVTFPVTSGSTYYIYAVDTTSGSAPLNSPLDVWLNEYDCPAFSPATVRSLVPGHLGQIGPAGIQVEFTAPIDPTAGNIRIVGDYGTDLSRALTGPEVNVAADGRSLSIDVVGELVPGENLVVSWSGIVDAQCGKPIESPTWSFSKPGLPCIPGVAGMVGNSITRVPVSIPAGTFTEYYVAADSDPNGYVYIGYTTYLYRAPKAGGPVEAVHFLADLRSEHMGYTMHIDGPDIYTTSTVATGTDPRVYRISSDGGATWKIENAMVFTGTGPADHAGGVATYDGRVYMVTNELTTGTNVEIWSAPIPGTATENARLEVAFGANAYKYCAGLAVDDAYYYTNCMVGTSTTNAAVVRVSRTDGSVTAFGENLFLGSTTAMALHGKDVDGDGLIDFIYRNEDREDGDYVCAPWSDDDHQVGQLFSFGTATANYGLGFDPVQNVLWAWDDDTNELIKVE